MKDKFKVIAAGCGSMANTGFNTPSPERILRLWDWWISEQKMLTHWQKIRLEMRLSIIIWSGPFQSQGQIWFSILLFPKHTGKLP